MVSRTRDQLNRIGFSAEKTNMSTQSPWSPVPKLMRDAPQCTPSPMSPLFTAPFEVASITPHKVPITPMGRWPHGDDIFMKAGGVSNLFGSTNYDCPPPNPLWESSDWYSDEMTPWKVETEEMLQAKRWNSVPKLKEIRNLPRRHLCLQLLEDGPDALKAGWAIKPAPIETEHFIGLSKKKPTKVLLSDDSDDEGATIAWQMDEHWVARKMEKKYDGWVAVETVALKKGDTAGRGVKPSEWASRFNRREKQIQVGKNTEGYRGLLRWREEHGANQGEPQTPRVAELSSKRQFDGRLSHWRILLHAFSQRDTEAGSTSSSRDTDEFTVYKI